MRDHRLVDLSRSERRWISEYIREAMRRDRMVPHTPTADRGHRIMMACLLTKLSDLEEES